MEELKLNNILCFVTFCCTITGSFSAILFATKIVNLKLFELEKKVESRNKLTEENLLIEKTKNKDEF